LFFFFFFFGNGHTQVDIYSYKWARRR
jgi:hypothetical protein